MSQGRGRLHWRFVESFWDRFYLYQLHMLLSRVLRRERHCCKSRLGHEKYPSQHAEAWAL
jgi:hypothetical protein